MNRYYHYRPVTAIVYSWMARRSGMQPFGKHVLSVLLHMAAGVTVLLLAMESMPLGAAWIAAALFVAHPLHVEAVAYMTGISEVLAGVLVLCAVVRRGAALAAVVRLRGRCPRFRSRRKPFSRFRCTAASWCTRGSRLAPARPSKANRAAKPPAASTNSGQARHPTNSTSVAPEYEIHKLGDDQIRALRRQFYQQTSRDHKVLRFRPQLPSWT